MRMICRANFEEQARVISSKLPKKHAEGRTFAPRPSGAGGEWRERFGAMAAMGVAEDSLSSMGIHGDDRSNYSGLNTCPLRSKMARTC